MFEFFKNDLVNVVYILTETPFFMLNSFFCVPHIRDEGDSLIAEE
jgi:hypothetical protein